MANFKEAMDILNKAEYSNAPHKCLHANKNEIGLTYMGIYQRWHPSWVGWREVIETLKACDDNLECASKELYKSEKLTKAVYEFYKEEFWDKARLDEISSQIIANEIFIFMVCAGKQAAIEYAQIVVRVKDDGVVGSKTLDALNKYDEEIFSLAYDVYEKKHFEDIASRDATKLWALKGWINRAYLV
ncbi:MAG: putative peptidoglycan-binding domain-containing protein [Sulfurospirillaceae bacterium]|nr:putative peptidoglycan-binding domain-containing protein [Sulfurospirillaceae bacterium]